MSRDITTQYTKDLNNTTGRKGYCLWKHEKVTVIKPSDYGMYLSKHRMRGQK